MTKKCPYCKSKNLRLDKEIAVCDDCGFHTIDQLYRNLSDDYETNPTTTFDVVMSKQPIIIRRLAVQDKNGAWWIPLIMDLSPKGIIFPIGDERYWVWVHAPYERIPDDKRWEYPIPGKPEEYYEYQLNLKKQTEYKKYSDALAVLQKQAEQRIDPETLDKLKLDEDGKKLD